MSAERVAMFISYVLSPPSSAACVSFVLSVMPPSQMARSLEPATALVLAVLFLVIAPVFPVALASYRGRTELDLPIRKERTGYLLLADVPYLIGLLTFYALEHRALFAMSACYLLVTTSILLINLTTKVSLHMAGLAGPLTAVMYMYGRRFAALFGLLVPVFWARSELGAHNRFQLALGGAVGIAVTWATCNALLP